MIIWSAVENFHTSCFLVLLICASFNSCNSYPDTNTPPEKSLQLSTKLTESEELIEDTNLPNNITSNFPLTPGNRWVYSVIEYDSILSDGFSTESFYIERITVTYLITETIVNTVQYNSFFVTEVNRETEVISSSVDLRNSRYENYLYYDDLPISYWYVVDHNKIYLQYKLNLDNLPSSTLEYVFPLADNKSWHPQSELPSLTRFTQIAENQHIPAGNFEDCFHIVTNFLSGAQETWFCNGIGVVRDKYEHRGTPYGHDAILVEYQIAKP